MTSMLGKYNGARPPAPNWFEQVMAQEPKRGFVQVDEAQIETLSWGEKGKPGLLFLHGDSAHADWWTHIVPFFSDRYYCVAMSWSGMGRSTWRGAPYTFDRWADEALAVLEATGLYESEVAPVIIAHSLGGYPALIVGQKESRIGGIVTVDSALVPEELMTDVPRPVPKPHRLYESETEALKRFRFMPPRAGDNDFLIDYIARKGLRQVTDAQGNEGWQWCFDPEIWRDMAELRGDTVSMADGVQCPIALLVGSESELINAEIETYMRGVFPAGTPFINIPDAGHHVMVDQPLAVVSALNAMFAFWPKN